MGSHNEHRSRALLIFVREWVVTVITGVEHFFLRQSLGSVTDHRSRILLTFDSAWVVTLITGVSHYSVLIEHGQSHWLPKEDLTQFCQSKGYHSDNGSWTLFSFDTALAVSLITGVGHYSTLIEHWQSTYRHTDYRSRAILTTDRVWVFTLITGVWHVFLWQSISSYTD